MINDTMVSSIHTLVDEEKDITKHLLASQLVLKDTILFVGKQENVDIQLEHLKINLCEIIKIHFGLSKDQDTLHHLVQKLQLDFNELYISLLQQYTETLKKLYTEQPVVTDAMIDLLGVVYIKQVYTPTRIQQLIHTCIKHQPLIYVRDNVLYGQLYYNLNYDPPVYNKPLLIDTVIPPQWNIIATATQVDPLYRDEFLRNIARVLLPRLSSGELESFPRCITHQMIQQLGSANEDRTATMGVICHTLLQFVANEQRQRVLYAYVIDERLYDAHAATPMTYNEHRHHCQDQGFQPLLPTTDLCASYEIAIDNIINVFYILYAKSLDEKFNTYNIGVFDILPAAQRPILERVCFDAIPLFTSSCDAFEWCYTQYLNMREYCEQMNYVDRYTLLLNVIIDDIVTLSTSQDIRMHIVYTIASTIGFIYYDSFATYTTQTAMSEREHKVVFEHEQMMTEQCSLLYHWRPIPDQSHYKDSINPTSVQIQQNTVCSILQQDDFIDNFTSTAYTIQKERWYTHHIASCAEQPWWGYYRSLILAETGAHAETFRHVCTRVDPPECYQPQIVAHTTLDHATLATIITKNTGDFALRTTHAYINQITRYQSIFDYATGITIAQNNNVLPDPMRTIANIQALTMIHTINTIDTTTDGSVKLFNIIANIPGTTSAIIMATLNQTTTHHIASLYEHMDGIVEHDELRKECEQTQHMTDALLGSYDQKTHEQDSSINDCDNLNEYISTTIAIEPPHDHLLVYELLQQLHRPDTAVLCDQCIPDVHFISVVAAHMKAVYKQHETTDALLHQMITNSSLAIINNYIAAVADKVAPLKELCTLLHPHPPTSWESMYIENMVYYSSMYTTIEQSTAIDSAYENAAHANIYQENPLYATAVYLFNETPKNISFYEDTRRNNFKRWKSIRNEQSLFMSIRRAQQFFLERDFSLPCIILDILQTNSCAFMNSSVFFDLCLYQHIQDPLVLMTESKKLARLSLIMTCGSGYFHHQLTARLSDKLIMRSPDDIGLLLTSYMYAKHPYTTELQGNVIQNHTVQTATAQIASQWVQHQKTTTTYASVMRNIAIAIGTCVPSICQYDVDPQSTIRHDIRSLTTENMDRILCMAALYIEQSLQTVVTTYMTKRAACYGDIVMSYPLTSHRILIDNALKQPTSNRIRDYLHVDYIENDLNMMIIAYITEQYKQAVIINDGRIWYDFDALKSYISSLIPQPVDIIPQPVLQQSEPQPMPTYYYGDVDNDSSMPLTSNTLPLRPSGRLTNFKRSIQFGCVRSNIDEGKQNEIKKQIAKQNALLESLKNKSMTRN